MKKGPRDDDIEYAIDDIEAVAAAWNYADEEYKKYKELMDRWKEARDQLRQNITDIMDAHGANVATVNGKPVCRWSHFTVDEFKIDKFREKYPELADEFTEQAPRTRFTPYRNFGKKENEQQAQTNEDSV